MALLSLPLKLVITVTTLGTPSEVRQALIDSGLRAKIENKIKVLAANDAQTGVPGFDFNLKATGGGDVVSVYPKMVITVETTRTEEQLLGVLEDYWADLKIHIRDLVSDFPNTWITSWHIHRASGSVDEVEP